MSAAIAPIDLELLLGLAVTERCCSDDLEEEPDCPLEAMAQRHAIVEKFVALRSQSSDGQETIRSLRGALPVFSLHAGRQRGATAHDRVEAVVWLLAARTHRTGDRADSYRWFEDLHARDRLFPGVADYERLFRRRNEQAIPILISRLAATLALAREHFGEPQTVLLPGGIAVTVMAIQEPADELGIIEQLWLAVDPRGLPPGWLAVIQAALLPDPDARDWQYTASFPRRPPDRRELRFELWHEVRE